MLRRELIVGKGLGVADILILMICIEQGLVEMIVLSVELLPRLSLLFWLHGRIKLILISHLRILSTRVLSLSLEIGLEAPGGRLRGSSLTLQLIWELGEELNGLRQPRLLTLTFLTYINITKTNEQVILSIFHLCLLILLLLTNPTLPKS